MRGITYFTLFGLIAVTSLRIGEALNLENTNVDLENMTLILPSGKTGEERFVPFTESTKLELTEYISERDRLTKQENELFFRQANGSKYSDSAARYNFAKISKCVGLRTQQKYVKHGKGPRIHDLRHTFAVQTIMEWLKKGMNPENEMYKLSSVLGHKKPDGTYWYIEAPPLNS